MSIMRKAFAATTCAVLVACNGAGLTADRRAEPAAEPTVRGPVVSVTHSATASGIHVGGGAGDACGIMATADARTHYLLRTRSGSLQVSSIADIAAGDTVEVYVDGPVAESCPLQGRAGTIIRAERP